jgi:hypothetical protein
MSALVPPQGVWWKQPLDRVEGTWIVIAFVWCLIMFFMMPYWHVFGKQNLSNEAYRTTPEMFQAKTQAMVDKFKVREETDLKIPVVAPPPGSDVYIIARLWSWWPMVELQEGKTYRLHSSTDGCTASRCSPRTSTSRCTPATSTSSRSRRPRRARTRSSATSTAASTTTRWRASSTS